MRGSRVGITKDAPDPITQEGIVVAPYPISIVPPGADTIVKSSGAAPDDTVVVPLMVDFNVLIVVFFLLGGPTTGPWVTIAKVCTGVVNRGVPSAAPIGTPMERPVTNPRDVPVEVIPVLSA